MQDMSPDMEDLMRKAAEAYPLKQMDDRWDEIVSKIGAPTAPLPPAKKQAGYRKYVIAFPLLLLFLFAGDYLISHIGKETMETNKRFVVAGKEIGTKQKIQSSVNSIQKMNSATSKDVIETNDNQLVNPLPPFKTTTFHATNFNNDRNNVVNGSINEETPFDTPTETRRKAQYEILNDDNIYLSANNLSFQLHNEPFFIQQNSKQKNNVRQKRFYYGISVGPSFNSVKEQNLKTGWGSGLLGGCYVNNHLSLETGVLLSQKYYWTSGNYFSMKKLAASMPPSMKIMEVDGSSRVLEIPLQIRYDVFQNDKRNIFSSAGFSSYILTKEYNQYHTSANGIMQMMYGIYKNNQLYFASSLDLSIGYAQNLSKNKSIRFQPYIQIPIKGTGMGNLKVMSTGLRIALVKRDR